jgi:tRNA modification GTPase
MNETLVGWKDTIVALATPKGIGAIGVIRLSGNIAIATIDKLFKSKNLSLQQTHTLHVGLLRYENEIIDEVVVSLYRNPRSYTGEDVIEISCHGSAFIQEKIIDILIKEGCRLAKPGEFTQRAFTNGKLDLTQAEAVADLIASNTYASRNNAIKNIRGGFKSDLSYLRERLIYFSSMIELELDFATEDVEFADRSLFTKLLYELNEANDKLLNSFKLGNVIKNGVQVAIIGKPNTGKSTLLNALLNENRSIVSDIAGTTRDTIEEVLNIDGVLFRLVDTAGIRDFTGDTIEKLGIEKSYEKMRMSDLVVYLFDLNTTTLSDIQTMVEDFNQQEIKYLLVGNKLDITNETHKNKFSHLNNLLFISAKEGIKIDLLKNELVRLAVDGDINTESTVITNIRHYDALKQLSASLHEVEQGLNNKVPGDLLSLDIRQCLYYLGLITGEITNEHQLDLIFGSFCIGK